MLALVERAITAPLKEAKVTINGDEPFDIRIHNDRVYGRVAINGSLGFGESYVDGDWDCDDLPELFNRLLRTGASKGHSGLTGTMLAVAQKLRNEQTVKRSERVAKLHYDLSPSFYDRWLGTHMVYTCGFWERAGTLDQAQIAKLQRLGAKLKLEPGMTVLDIGCGFGTTAKYLAEKFGVHVVGITISREQLAYGKRLCEGMENVELVDMNYLHLLDNFEPHSFDRIVSVGMFEHVGPRNHREFMRIASKLLKRNGLMLLHTIGGNDQGGFEPWIALKIFPGGWIPSLKEIIGAVKGQLLVEDLENFGPDYDRTLCAWSRNFVKAWPDIKGTEPHFDDRFYRMWRYYLGSCAGAFRARHIQLYQFVLRPHGAEGAYRSVRP